MKEEKKEFINNSKMALNKIKRELKEYKEDLLTAAIELISHEPEEDDEIEKEQDLAKC